MTGRISLVDTTLAFRSNNVEPPRRIGPLLTMARNPGSMIRSRVSTDSATILILQASIRPSHKNGLAFGLTNFHSELCKKAGI